METERLGWKCFSGLVGETVPCLMGGKPGFLARLPEAPGYSLIPCISFLYRDKELIRALQGKSALLAS